MTVKSELIRQREWRAWATSFGRKCENLNEYIWIVDSLRIMLQCILQPRIWCLDVNTAGIQYVHKMPWMHMTSAYLYQFSRSQTCEICVFLSLRVSQNNHVNISISGFCHYFAVLAGFLACLYYSRFILNPEEIKSVFSQGYLWEVTAGPLLKVIVLVSYRSETQTNE